MDFTWLLDWDINQKNPIVKYARHEELVSFASFPDNPHSFVIFQGFLFDKHNFRAGKAASDASRVVEYYQIFGEELFTKLRGGFSLAIWDADRRKLIAGRDHMGQIPLYYFWDGKRFSLSSSMKELLNQPGIDNSFNRVLIAEYLMHNWTDYQRTETFFVRVQRLPPAEFLRIENQILSSTCYWNPIPPGFRWASEEESDTVIDLFGQAVDRCLSVGADSISLSGGYDSTSIAVMANNINKSENYLPLYAISGKVESTGADDGNIQRDVAQTLNMPQTLCTIEDLFAGESIIHASVGMSNRSPIPNLNFLESFYSGVMEKAAEHNLSKILMGTGGDELFFVGESWADDLIASFKFRKYFNFKQILDVYLGYESSGNTNPLSFNLAKKLLIASLDQIGLTNAIKVVRDFLRPNRQIFPAWISRSDTQLIKQLEYRYHNPQYNLDEEGGNYVQSLRKILHSPYYPFFIEHRYFYARHVGFINLFPYFDMDLMDLAYRIRPEFLVSDGLIKAPLQQFLHENLPDIQWPSKKTDYSKITHATLRSQGKLLWSDIGGAEVLKNLDIIDEINTKSFIDTYFNEHSQLWNIVWQILSTETWLRMWDSKS